MAAETAADVTEEEAVVAGVQAVREGPVEARQASLETGAGRVVCRRAAATAAALEPAADALGAPTLAAPSAAVSRQRRTLCRKAWTRVT